MIDPVSTALSISGVAGAIPDVVKDQVKSIVSDFIKDKIVTRWSKYRADQFLSAFVDEVNREADVRTQSAGLNDMLREIGEKAERTSSLFDAYRRVALSASKTVGPQVIGLLVARILLEDREATFEEEQIFDAAEALNDREFTSFLSWMEYARVHESYAGALSAWSTGDTGHNPASILVSGMVGPAHGSDALDLEGFLPDANFNLYRDVGPFAVKLTNCGLMEESAQPRGLPRDPKEANYYLLVTFTCERLYQLASRSIADAI
jgi:hypothetical protein